MLLLVPLDKGLETRYVCLITTEDDLKAQYLFEQEKAPIRIISIASSNDYIKRSTVLAWALLPEHTLQWIHRGSMYLRARNPWKLSIAPDNWVQESPKTKIWS